MNQASSFPTLKKACAEMIGVFALVFAGCGSIMVCEQFQIAAAGVIIPIVFGSVIAVMIYACGHISGAHFNPAVTLAFALTRHFPPKQVLIYWIAQCAGGFIAIFLLTLLLPQGSTFGATIPHVSLGQALGWEIVLTFFLMFVIMAVATDTRVVGAIGGGAIGLTVMLDAFVGGPVTGASMNPARSLAPAVFEGRLDVIWIYIAGPIIGAAIAAFVYSWIRCEFDKDKKDVKGCC